MKMEIFNESIPFKGGQRYLQVGMCEERVPIYTTKDVPREAVALVGGSEPGKVSIVFNDEVYGILKRSRTPSKYLKIICERGIEHGFASFYEIPRTTDELEVLGFLREHGIGGDIISEARQYMEAREFERAQAAYTAAASFLEMGDQGLGDCISEIRDSLKLLGEWKGLSDRATKAEDATNKADREVGSTSGHGQEKASAQKNLDGLKLVGETETGALKAYESELSAMWRETIAEQDV